MKILLNTFRDRDEMSADVYFTDDKFPHRFSQFSPQKVKMLYQLFYNFP